MSEKQVIVELSKNTLESLKKAGYSLCFAKNVNGTYNVIWKASKQYLGKTTFSWKPEYAVFGTNTYKNSIKVQADTNIENAELGQKCTLTEFGVMKRAVSGGVSTAITIKNEYGPIHSGISQVCVIGNEKELTPIYVSTEERTKGEIVMTPEESVMVWFEANVETSTIFEDARTNAIVIDLSQKNMERVGFDYETGTWEVLGAE